MENLKVLERILRPLRQRISLIVGRAILAAVANSGKTQRLQLDLMAGEVSTGVERFEEYGFESYPEPGAEAAAVFLAGNREHGIVLCVHDRRYRPTDLEEGDAQIYTKWGRPGAGHRVWLRRIDGKVVIQEDCDNQTISARVGREITTPLTTHTGDYLVKGNLTVTINVLVQGTTHSVGAITCDADVSDMIRSMAADRILYNSHTHNCQNCGPVGPPTVLM
jgi:phage baseplate assembly protein V